MSAAVSISSTSAAKSGPDGDAILAGGLLVLLGVMLVPLPQVVLDLLITANLALSLLVLVTVLRAREPLEFSTFPSVLLFATLWRLSLNVASARLILLEGDAGAVIHAFGHLVIGGNIFVGGVVFLILVVVQFVVITKGATRVSEVAARFTLDALPGKQMAIDADLAAGHIREDQARARRAAVSREAEFHGAMDGASKFVRGDAVAGLLITAINIIGGIIVGLSNGLGVMEALQKYAVLTVGDGLVTQVPALLISVAAGIITVKSSSNSSLSADLGSELLSRPGLLGTVAAMVLTMALAPGIPKLPFLAVGGAAAALMSMRRATQAAEAVAGQQAATSAEGATPADPVDAVQDALQVDRLTLELGYSLVPMADATTGGTVVERIALLRKQVAGEWGWMVPPVRVKESLALPPDGYRVLIAGHEVAAGSIQPARYLAIGPAEATAALEGTPTTEPAFGVPAAWIREEDRALAELRGCTVVDPTTVLVTHLGEVVRAQAPELLSRDDVQALLEQLKRHAPAVVSEAWPTLVSLGEVQRVLAALLRDRVPIRQLAPILEALADQAPRGKDPAALVEAARGRVARAVVAPHLDGEGRLLVITLDPRVERRLVDGLTPRPGAAAAEAGLDGPFLHGLVEGIAAETRRAAERPGGRDPVLVVQAALRPKLGDLLRSTLPRLAVLSYAELGGARRVESVGVVKPLAEGA